MKNKYFEEFIKKGYFEEFEKELKEVINPLQNNWNNLSEKDLESLLKKFGKITRDETSQLKKEILSEGAIAKTLLGIASKYYNNSKMLTEIISSIDNMHNRYGLEITNDIFEFLTEQTKNKKVNYYVSIFITSLPQFEKYEYKWDYILSIPDIAPKKKSINIFYRVINNNVEDIPNKDKMNVIKVFEAFLNDNPDLHKTIIEKYSSMIDKLKD